MTASPADAVEVLDQLLVVRTSSRIDLATLLGLVVVAGLMPATGLLCSTGLSVGAAA